MPGAYTVVVSSADPRQLLVERVVGQLVKAAEQALGRDLLAVILFGAAAEQRVLPASEVDLLFVLEAFDSARLVGLCRPLRAASEAINVAPLFVLKGELSAACEALPEQFAEMARRRRVLYGSDVLAEHMPSQRALAARLAQLLLNDALRLRRSYALSCLRDEQATRALADATAALRSGAASLLELQGRQFASPKQALQRWAETQPGGPNIELVAALSRAHAGQSLPPGAAAKFLLQASSLALAMRDEALARTGNTP